MDSFGGRKIPNVFEKQLTIGILYYNALKDT